MNENYLKQLAKTYSDQILPPFDSLIKLMGYDALCDLSTIYGGTSIYIPTRKRMFSGCVKKQIIKNFDGHNYKELAKEFGYCERSIRNIIS